MSGLYKMSVSLTQPEEAASRTRCPVIGQPLTASTTEFPLNRKSKHFVLRNLLSYCEKKNNPTTVKSNKLKMKK